MVKLHIKVHTEDNVVLFAKQDTEPSLSFGLISYVKDRDLSTGTNFVLNLLWKIYQKTNKSEMCTE